MLTWCSRYHGKLTGPDGPHLHSGANEFQETGRWSETRDRTGSNKRSRNVSSVACFGVFWASLARFANAL